MKRGDLLYKGKSIADNSDIVGWYCEGLVLIEGRDNRLRKAFLIPQYSDLRQSKLGVTRLYGFVEVDPKTVELLTEGC